MSDPESVIAPIGQDLQMRRVAEKENIIFNCVWMQLPLVF
jgi:hypothetical protein